MRRIKEEINFWSSSVFIFPFVLHDVHIDQPLVLTQRLR
jgi:hypothetical protein